MTTVAKAIKDYPGDLEERRAIALRYFCNEAGVKTLNQLGNPKKASFIRMLEFLPREAAERAASAARWLLSEQDRNTGHLVPTH